MFIFICSDFILLDTIHPAYLPNIIFILLDLSLF